MRLKRPSPAMVVALVALVMSMAGGAIAAVNYAQNAGKVDGYDAVKAKSSNRKAAGNLVATYPGGKLRGKLPFRFLSGAASKGDLDDLADEATLGRNGVRVIPVPDNSTTTADTMIDLDLGSLQVSCFDQANQPANENAATHINITNGSGAPINVARRVGVSQPPAISTLENGTADSFDIGGDNTFEVQLQGGTTTVLIDGTVRQSGQGTADSGCGVWATALIVK